MLEDKFVIKSVNNFARSILMLFWKGYGILGFLIPALVFIVLLLIGKIIFGIEDDFSMDKTFLFI